MSDMASARAHMPVGTERFLDERTLERDHRALARLLTPGLDVLDVGCGSGAITVGVARAVAPGGEVLGIDVNSELISLAEQAGAEEPNLHFAATDIRRLDPEQTFDVVTAARVLQWLADPQVALSAMVAATRPGGHVVVLDYNHAELLWEPDPPPSFHRFYRAFLEWRDEAGMDNHMADHLGALFSAAGLEQVTISDEAEITRRDDPDFATRVALWAEVIATRGHQLVGDGKISEAERAEAEREFRTWIADRCRRQVLTLKAVVGRKRAA
jgi:SAM-dependent methyltransferase